MSVQGTNPRQRPVWKAAVAVLEQSNNPAVMAGDDGLLHLIADELGWRHEGPKTADRVWAALRRNHGKLLRRWTRNARGRRVLVLRLPDTN